MSMSEDVLLLSLISNVVDWHIENGQLAYCGFCFLYISVEVVAYMSVIGQDFIILYFISLF